LVKAKRAVSGDDNVLLNGRSLEWALAEEISAEELNLSGGVGGGQFRVTVLKSEVGEKPGKFTPIEVRGVELLVLDPVVERNGATYELTAGDPATEDR
jgi:hypothetical protein